MSEKILDARGLSCPEPVLLAKQVLKNSPNGGFTVAVSTPTARDNVASLLEAGGFSPSIEKQQDDWFIQVPSK